MRLKALGICGAVGAGVLFIALRGDHTVRYVEESPDGLVQAIVRGVEIPPEYSDVFSLHLRRSEGRFGSRSEEVRILDFYWYDDLRVKWLDNSTLLVARQPTRPSPVAVDEGRASFFNKQVIRVVMPSDPDSLRDGSSATVQSITSTLKAHSEEEAQQSCSYFVDIDAPENGQSVNFSVVVRKRPQRLAANGVWENSPWNHAPIEWLRRNGDYEAWLPELSTAEASMAINHSCKSTAQLTSWKFEPFRVEPSKQSPLWFERPSEFKTCGSGFADVSPGEHAANKAQYQAKRGRSIFKWSLDVDQMRRSLSESSVADRALKLGYWIENFETIYPLDEAAMQELSVFARCLSNNNHVRQKAFMPMAGTEWPIPH